MKRFLYPYFLIFSCIFSMSPLQAQNICTIYGPPDIIIRTPQVNATVTGIVSVTYWKTPNRTCINSETVRLTVKGGPYNQTLVLENNSLFGSNFDSNQLEPGKYKILASYNVDGGGASDSIDITIIKDLEGPRISMPGIVDNSTLVGTAAIPIDAYDPSGIQDIQILLGSTEVGYINGSGGKTVKTTYTIDSTNVPDGTYDLIARATDGIGNISEYSLSAKVNNIDDKPEVSIISPAAGSEVSGNIRVRTNTTDDNGIASLSCYINGVQISTDLSSPYDCVINTLSYDDGPYQIAVIARDTASQTATKFLTLYFKNSNNEAPTVDLLAPTQGKTLKGATTFLVSASDDFAVKKVEYYLGSFKAGTATSSPFSLNFDTTALSDGIYQLTAVVYDYEDLVGTDFAIINIRNGDYNKPGVILQSPEDGDTLSGTVALTAVAVDNVAVKEVRYYFGGELLGIRSVAPYTFTIDTATLTDGDHTLTAIAVDYAGNQSEPHTINVTIDSFAPPVNGDDTEVTDTTDEQNNNDHTGDETLPDGSSEDEDLEDTVASLANDLNSLINTVNTLKEDQSQLEEQVTAIQAMLAQLLEIFANGSDSEALMSNPKKGQRLTRRANRKVLRMLKARSKRAFKKRRRKAKRALRQLANFLSV